jgi:hypothetical protein
VSATEDFERMAVRGVPRGADAVLRAARTPRRTTAVDRQRWHVWVPITAIVSVLVLVVVLTWQARTEDSRPVDPVPDGGYLFGEPTDATLLINTMYGSMVAFDLDAGVARQYRDLDVEPTYTSQDVILRAGDRIVYQGARGTVSLPLDLAGPPALIGPSGGFLSSGSPDRVWLYGGERVEERTVSGEVTVPLTPFPEGTDGAALPTLGVDDLLTVIGSTNLYWEPGTGRQFGATTGSIDDAVMAARGSTAVVGAPTAIERPSAGTSVAVDPGLDAIEMAVSPDESAVAAWANDDSSAEGGGSLVLVDTSTGHWRRVPGTSGARGASLAWSDDGRWVFALSRGAADEDVAGVFVTAYRLDRSAGTTVEMPSFVSGGIVALDRGEGPRLTTADVGPCPEPEVYPPTTGGFVPAGPDGLVTEAPDPTTPISDDRPCLVRLVP